MILDPGDDRAVSGKVQIMGDLQVDGTTTTVNSTVTTVDDPIITLGGDTAPGSDDNKDRGVEFRYYDASAKVGFFGYDDSAADLGGHTGAFTFLYDATNSSEVFSGTDAGIIAGNLKLTTNTNSTSNTTGDLVVAGGVGIGDDVNIGGSVDIDTNFRTHGTSRFDDEVVIQGASKDFIMKNGSGTAKITAGSTTGNITMEGVLAVTGNVDVNTNKFNKTAASGNTAIAGTLTVSDETIVKADNKFFKVQTAGGTDKFTVDTDNGNTDIEGTLNVASLLHFESTDAPDVALNNSNNLYEIQSSDYGALRVDGGGFFDKAVLFNSDIYLNGDFNQRDSGTESWGLRNWLQVRYKGRFGSSVAYTPTYATHNTSNLRVYGGAGIATNLHIGGTGSGEGLFVGKKNSGDTVKFQVLGASGDITSDGVLTQNGNAEFNGTVDVDGNFAVRSGTTDKFTIASATGNAVNEGDLNVKGAVDFDTTLNVDGATTIQDDLIVKSDAKYFKVQTAAAADKFTVDTDNGNTVISGTLQVDGQINVNDSVIIDEANEVFSIRNGSGVEKFGVDTDDGNTNIIGTLTVGDATQINDTFGVSGVVTATANTEQTLTGSYAADGAARFSGGIGLAKNLAVGGGARVYGNTELTGTLDLNNSADISGALVTHDDVTITADNKMFKVQNGSAANKFTVDTDNGNTDIQGTLDVAGDVTASSNLVITGNLTVNGTTTTVNSTTTTYDDPIITLGGDTAPASNDAKDRGVEFRYYDGSAKIGFFGYDRSSQEFAFLTSATNSSEVLTGTDGALRVGSVHVTGAGTAVDIDNNLNVDGSATIDGQITSNVADGTAPLVVTSTTKVVNLNADLLDGATSSQLNVPATIVNRDTNGDFAANQITCSSAAGAGAGFLGNATSADAWKTARVLTIDGVVDGSVSIDGSAAVTLTTTYNDADITALAAMSGTGYVVRTAANTYAQRTLAVTASSGITLTNADGVSGNTTINVASASTNAANNLVIRDGSGDFAANEITSDLVGNLTGATSTAKDLNPAADSTYDLGTTSVRWQGIFADAANITAITGTLTGDVTGNITGNVAGDLTGNIVGTTSTAKNLNPAADSTYDLGTTSVRWQNIYGDAANITAITGTLTGDVTGDLTGNADSATLAATVTVADESTDTSCNVLFTTAATGSLAVKSGTNLTFNSATGILTATGFAGPITGAVTGNATTATTLATARNIGGVSFDGSADINLPGVNAAGNQDTSGTAAIATEITATANNSTDETVYPTFVDGVSGTQGIETDSGLTYNPSTGVLTTTSVTGNLTGNVTGNTSGSSGSCLGNAATATEATNFTVTANNSTDETVYPVFVDGGSGTQGAETDTGLTYNPNSGVLTATSFTGDVTGNVTGTVSSLANQTSTALAEGTNLYYTEARVQAKLDNAYAQLKAMLNNLATATTLTLNLSGDPTPGSVVTLGAIASGGLGGFTASSNVATSGGTGSSLTVDTTVDAAGAITGLALNAAGTGYLIGDTLTITNPNLGGVSTLNLGTLVGGTGYSTATGVATTSSGSGSNATVDITATNGVITNVTVNNAGSGYANGETLTIANANASGVKTLGSIATAGTGYSAGTVASTASGSGAGLTVSITVDGSGAVTGATIVNDGLNYAAAETITLTNANASGVKTLGTISAAGTGYTEGTTTGVATTSSGSGTGLTVDVTANASGNVTAVAINVDGLNYAASEVITITGGGGDATIPVSAIHGNGATLPVSAIHGTGASLNTSTTFTNATFALSDITTMEVGATVTGGTSGTTGVITALGTNAITVDTVDGFFKVGETVGANDVTNLTISSFA